MNGWMDERVKKWMDECVQPGDLQHAHLVIHCSCHGNQTDSSCCHAPLANATCIALLCDIAAGQCQEHGISAHDRAQILPAAQRQGIPGCQVMLHSHITLSECVCPDKQSVLQARSEAIQTKAAELHD